MAELGRRRQDWKIHRYAPAMILACAVAIASRGAADARSASEYVNALRGSDSSPDYSHGNTFPAVALPFGFNFWTPVTSADANAWIYDYRSPTISGFAISHEPSPWIGDYASLRFSPGIRAIHLSPKDRAARFRHRDETARAHRYKVVFASGIATEFSPSEHGAIFKFAYPADALPHLVFDRFNSEAAQLTIDPSTRSLQGYVDSRGPRMYVSARFDQPIRAGARDETTVALTFPPRTAFVVMRIATSFISVEQAKLSLERELAGKSLEQVENEAKARWDELLGRIELEGASEDRATTLYSNLYRAFLYPNTMSEFDANGERHFSPYLDEVRAGGLYVNNGFWDTYRAAWPLYTLLAPTQTGRMLTGFLNAYREGGWTPRWSGPGYIDMMVGTHTDIVFADAYAKGIRNFDARLAYESMLKNALVDSLDRRTGRHGNRWSVFRGFVPSDRIADSASWQLEDCINDFGISIMAEALSDSVDAAYFKQRALAYPNLFSSSVGFFRGKRLDGSFRTSDRDFRPNEWGNEFSEGSAWQYVAAAAHDPGGMANLYGGVDAFAKKLAAVLHASPSFERGSYPIVIHEMREAYDANMGQYAHSNEPVQHLLYMFDYVGQPWQTQRYVREVSTRLYGSGLNDGRGYLGDEDNGQMSAWYVWSALGLYPASPGHAEYAIGSPLHDRMTLHLENGRTFTVVARGQAPDHPYIQKATLDGVAYDKVYLSHAALVRGGVLELWMGPAPSTWGAGPEARPSSITIDSRAPMPLRDCAHDGSVSASGENASAHEGGSEAFDDDSNTKWLTFSNEGSLAYALRKPCVMQMYTLTSANDEPERDPRDWTLEASHDGLAWVALDARRDQSFQWRRQTRVFGSSNRDGYEHYRLRITRNHSAPATQLAELELLRASDDSEEYGHGRMAGRSGCSASGRATGLEWIALSGWILWARRRRAVRA